MVKPHISISEDLKSRLDVYCKENNFQCFSHGVIDLLEKALSEKQVESLADQEALEGLPDATKATPADFETEYLDYILSVKCTYYHIVH